MRPFLMCLYAICALSNIGFAQNCHITIKGKVTGINAENPLEEVTVIGKESEQGVFTDEKGRFVLAGLCGGLNTIVISRIGFETQVIDLYLTRDTMLMVKLNYLENEFSEVGITAAKTQSHETQSSVTLEAKKLDELRGLSLSKALEKVPGIYSLNTGATISKPVIHGLHSNRVLILNNDVRLESQQWGSEHAPEIDPFTAKKIVVVKGANSLRYGSDAIGGVILVNPDPLPSLHGISGEVNFAAFSNNAEANLSATLEGCHHRVPALSWRVQGTYRQAANSRAPAYWLGNTGLQEGDFSAALGYKKSAYGVEVFYSRFQSKIGILSAAHIGTVADLEAAIERGYPAVNADFSYAIGRPYQTVVHNLAKARAYFQSRKAGEFALQFSWQNNERSEYDVPHFYQQNKNRPGFYFQIQTMAADFEWRHKPVKNVSGILGLSGTTQTNNIRYGYFIPDMLTFATGIFAIERYSLSNIDIEGGLRFDYKWGHYLVRNTSYRFDTVLRFFAPSGNIGFEYHVKKGIKWRMNFGSAFRAPAPNELFADGVHHGAATYETGNRTLKPEQSFNLSTSLDYQSILFTANIELYTNYILNFINLVPVQPPKLTIRGAFPSFIYQQQNALLNGADIDLSLHPYKGLELFNKTSLLFSRNTVSKDWLAQMPPFRFQNGTRYTAIITSRKIKEVYAGFSFVNVLKQFLLPAQNNDYASPPPAYWLLNIEAGMSLDLGGQKITIGVTVDNATNNKYRDYLDRLRYYADAAGVNCALRLKWQFFKGEH